MKNYFDITVRIYRTNGNDDLVAAVDNIMERCCDVVAYAESEHERSDKLKGYYYDGDESEIIKIREDLRDCTLDNDMVIVTYWFNDDGKETYVYLEGMEFDSRDKDLYALQTALLNGFETNATSYINRMAKRKRKAERG